MALRKFFCTFPQELISQPILHTIGEKFRVVPNIRGEHHGCTALCQPIEGRAADGDW
jgi:hypothetical protein